MQIKILGPGCRNCQKLEHNTREAVARLGLDAEVVKVTDYGEIAGYGVLRTPGLVVDEEVVSTGSVPRSEEIVALLTARTPTR
jgi:small redox-active disulfide protein 2